MKIAILTQPLGRNYGGILQAYALQQSLTTLGHEASIVKRVDNYPGLKLLVWRLASFIKCLINKYIRKNGFVAILNPFSEDYITDIRIRYDYSALEDFILNHISQTKTIRSSKALRKYLVKNNYQYIVVGSDQVWREEYSPCILDFFGGFLKSKDNLKLMSYAASFGLEEIPISNPNKDYCKTLLSRFTSVSVREESARNLLLQEWNLKANVVLDPTFLIGKTIYESLILNSHKSDLGVFAYILDDDFYKEQIVHQVAQELCLNVETIMLYPKDINGHAGKLASISDWLYNISNAKFVVTDSYHGCVFSIIFNKPFIVLANKKRGLDRFLTLLNLLDLTHRLVFSGEQISKDLLKENINYEKVNNIIEKERLFSINYLKCSLGTDGVNYSTCL